MNWTTFDVVGELVFGTTFDSLSNFEYHPWVLLIIRSMKESSTVAALHYLGVGWVNSVLYKSVGSPGLKNVIGCTDEMLKHRLENDPECQDLFEGLVKKQAEWVCDAELWRSKPKPCLLLSPLKMRLVIDVKIRV